MLKDLEVKKPVEYVMINIPIPAGCVYTSKPKGKYHRIYQKDRVFIFANRLYKGTYKFSIPLTARYKGTYTLNPAKVELMYFPVFYGNNKLKTVIIK